ncbi:MAG: hypothetical protein WEA04_04105 [Candidatus Andersenbacteria bacterium]
MSRKVFIVVAGGNMAAERHFEDTVQQKRQLSEVRQYLPQEEVENLERIYHGASFIVWGAVPGPMNEQRWQAMAPGDAVLIYNKGYVRAIGEIAATVHSKELARHFWRETAEGETWELIYFIVNEQRVNVPLSKINPLFGYKGNYSPQGLTMVDSKKVQKFSQQYGDILGVVQTLSLGEDIHTVAEPPREELLEEVEEKIATAPTEHDEMQWRLIRLGQLAKCDVWVPSSDQGHSYQGNTFRDFVIHDFHESIDVPKSVKNIDVVWKFGPYSIKSAFEIEHSTSVYSGILRLSDLRALSPNSTYPLFIVADRKRQSKIFRELERPTFSGPCLRLHEVIAFLDYAAIREIDEEAKKEFDSSLLFARAQKIIHGG